jgi:glutaminyl-tRNA synthetase
VIKNDQGEIVELRCTWDPDSLGGNAKDGRKIKGTLHWVSAAHAVDAEVRLYDRLFVNEQPGEDEGDFIKDLNPSSREIVLGAKLEPALAAFAPGDHAQFERVGYFTCDKDSKPGALVFNRTIGLRDSFAAKQGK